MKRKINNGVFYVVISLVALLAVGSVAMAFVGNANRVIENVEVYQEAPQPTTYVEDGNLRGSPGPNIYQETNFHEGVRLGGKVYATSTNATVSSYVLTADPFVGGNRLINWEANLIATITTMASSTLDMDRMEIPNAGDSVSYWFSNASTTVSTVQTAIVTFAAGTGVDIQMTEDNADLGVGGLDMVKLTWIRKANTDVMLVFDEYMEAD